MSARPSKLTVRLYLLLESSAVGIVIRLHCRDSTLYSLTEGRQEGHVAHVSLTTVMAAMIVACSSITS